MHKRTGNFLHFLSIQLLIFASFVFLIFVITSANFVLLAVLLYFNIYLIVYPSGRQPNSLNGFYN